MLKILIVTISIVFTFIAPGYCCTIACDTPSKLEKNIFIGEGRIVGYKGNFSKDDVTGEFGVMEILVTKMHYPNEKPTKIYISQFGINEICQRTGNSKETLMRHFPEDQIISFVGQKIEVLGDSILHIGNFPCHPLIMGSVENRLKFDYENQRRGENLHSEILYDLRRAIAFNYWEQREDESEAILIAEELYNNIYIPEQMQIYLDLAEIERSKTREGRFYILRNLIWSWYISDPEFIQDQRVSKKQKLILLTEYARINREWPRG